MLPLSIGVPLSLTVMSAGTKLAGRLLHECARLPPPLGSAAHLLFDGGHLKVQAHASLKADRDELLTSIRWLPPGDDHSVHVADSALKSVCALHARIRASELQTSRGFVFWSSGTGGPPVVVNLHLTLCACWCCCRQ